MPNLAPGAFLAVCGPLCENLTSFPIFTDERPLGLSGHCNYAHFFTEIRQSLIDSGSASKYFLYAIGEILLVVMGILIALWINSAYQNKKDRTAERIYLAALLNDIEADIQMFSQTNKTVINRSKDLKNILTWLKTGHIPDKSLYVGATLAMSNLNNFTIKKSTFNEMQSSGKLDLIVSNQTRKSIIEYYAKMDEFMNAHETRIAYNLDAQRFSKLSSFLDFNSIASNVDHEIPEVDSMRIFEFNNKDHPLREEFADIVSLTLWLRGLNRRLYKEAIERGEKLKEKIQKELKE